LEEQLTTLEIKYQELLTQIDTRQELLRLLAESKTELEKLKQKYCKHKYLIEDLLKAQDNICYDISSSHHYYREMKEISIKRLKEQGLREEKIEQLCQIQSEITNLEIQLKDNKILLISIRSKIFFER